MTIAQEVRESFIEQLGTVYAAAYPRHLEQNYPHVFANIVRLWGTPEMEPYFNNLLVTDRPNRQGFSDAAGAEILRLIDTYRKLGLAVQPPKQSGDVWDWVDDIGHIEKEQPR